MSYLQCRKNAFDKKPMNYLKIMFSRNSALLNLKLLLNSDEFKNSRLEPLLAMVRLSATTCK